jgi:hypothetical protein
MIRISVALLTSLIVDHLSPYPMQLMQSIILINDSH